VKTYRFLWALIRYRPWLYIVNATLWTLIHLAPLIPGLIIERFFNVFGSQTPSDSVVWGLIALLVATAVARSAFFVGGIFVDQLHRFTMSGLLRRNILMAILEQPGAAALKHAPGDALNRLREDAQYAEDSISWTLDVIGMGSFAIRWQVWWQPLRRHLHIFIVCAKPAAKPLEGSPVPSVKCLMQFSPLRWRGQRVT